ncbi:MAG: Fis family transcriptional regulator [Deltaproteobacteria bacterium GWC2_42_11]|nr:MAG: Fis family transcriptional regulator [Deltaproteobacteria bacterium GWC2_42_11]HBO84819.1 Fis family transcriptional regulator [Deltaproteobacteria bacterium]
MKKIMVVDDEDSIRRSLSGILKDDGFEVILAKDGAEALKKIAVNKPDLILLDIWMPGMDGTEVLREIKDRYPSVAVIMISGHGNIETAVKTTKMGAYDFIEKPLSLDKVVLTINHALEHKRLEEENNALRSDIKKHYNIIGKSKAIEAIRSQIERVASSNSWVLISGENGTGKELVARNIHLLSSRKDKPFVEVNCAAIPEELIESELFGHERGAFTGAVSQKTGKFELADGGSIFLDEIGDMSLRTQAKVLRVLQEQKFERVGGTQTIEVDVRVIAATNKNLLEEIQKGSFREDLYYRLNVIPFHIPPLRERREDINMFTEYYLQEFERETTKGKKEVTKDAVALIERYNWPGNVRELKNLIERLVIMTPSDIITPADLPSYITTDAVEEIQQITSQAKDTLKEARKDFEREFILKKLEEFGGNIAKTADAIGIERSHLYRKIKDYGIEAKVE